MESRQPCRARCSTAKERLFVRTTVFGQWTDRLVVTTVALARLLFERFVMIR